MRDSATIYNPDEIEKLMAFELCDLSMNLHEITKIRVGPGKTDTTKGGQLYHTRTIILKTKAGHAFRLTLFANTINDLTVEFGG